MLAPLSGVHPSPLRPASRNLTIASATALTARSSNSDADIDWRTLALPELRTLCCRQRTKTVPACSHVRITSRPPGYRGLQAHACRRPYVVGEPRADVVQPPDGGWDAGERLPRDRGTR